MVVPESGKPGRRRSTRLLFDERGLWRVVSRVEGCFPDVSLTRRSDETEVTFRRRISESRPGLLNG
jgi:hypothetical protein